MLLLDIGEEGLLATAGFLLESKYYETVKSYLEPGFPYRRRAVRHGLPILGGDVEVCLNSDIVTNKGQSDASRMLATALDPSTDLSHVFVFLENVG